MEHILFSISNLVLLWFLLPAPVCGAEQKDKTEPFDVEEVVQEMPRDQRQTLWGKLASLLQDVLQELPPERWEEEKKGREEGREEGMEVESAADPVSPPVYVT